MAHVARAPSQHNLYICIKPEPFLDWAEQRYLSGTKTICTMYIYRFIRSHGFSPDIEIIFASWKNVNNLDMYSTLTVHWCNCWCTNIYTNISALKLNLLYCLKEEESIESIEKKTNVVFFMGFLLCFTIIEQVRRLRTQLKAAEVLPSVEIFY